MLNEKYSNLLRCFFNVLVHKLVEFVLKGNQNRYEHISALSQQRNVKKTINSETKSPVQI